MQHVSRGIISRLVQVHTNLETSSSPVSTALPLSLVASLGDVLDGALPALEKTVRMEVLCCRSPRISEARRCSASGTNASSSTHNPHTCQVSRIPLLLLHVDELHRCGQHNRRRRSTVSESMADFGRRMESTHREAGEEEQHAKLLGGGAFRISQELITVARHTPSIDATSCLQTEMKDVGELAVEANTNYSPYAGRGTPGGAIVVEHVSMAFSAPPASACAVEISFASLMSAWWLPCLFLEANSCICLLRSSAYWSCDTIRMSQAAATTVGSAFIGAESPGATLGRIACVPARQYLGQDVGVYLLRLDPLDDGLGK